MADMSLAKAARSAWWLLLVLAALVLLVASFFHLREREPPATAAPAKPAASQTSYPGGFPPALADARPDLSTRADYVEVCGVGRVPSDEARFWREYEESGRRLIETTASSRATSGNDLDRALALYVAPMLVASAAPPRDGGEPTRSSGETFQQLARFAVASRDPETYALAFNRCGVDCPQLSSARWAQLEPDNAAPWLYEADLAQRRNDPAGVDAALLRASKARTFEPYESTPLHLIDTPAVRSAPPPAAGAAIISLVGMAAAMPWPNLQVALQYCAAAAKGAAQRRQLCSDLAGVLAERSTVLLGMAIGAKIGAQAGWPAERVAAVRSRVKALEQVKVANSKDIYSCAALERNRRYFADFARLGEVAAAERAAIDGQQNSK
jgi:hypothetical protein